MEEIKGYSKDAIVRVSNKESSNLMTKNIIKIIENKEGDINPITDLHESPVYNILFDDATERKLFRHKMIEYLSMAYGKSVQKFKKVIVTTDVSSTTIWVIVTQDYQLEVLPPPKFYARIEEGHSNRDLEINRKFQWNYEKANQ
tara:strand:- start:4314 stop:4745 length:432 start_codon:yes stop_codon:yes gene_type:complete